MEIGTKVVACIRILKEEPASKLALILFHALETSSTTVAECSDLVDSSHLCMSRMQKPSEILFAWAPAKLVFVWVVELIHRTHRLLS